MHARRSRIRALAATLTATVIAGAAAASAASVPRTLAVADRAELSRLAQSYLQQRADLVTRPAAQSPVPEPPTTATPSMRAGLRMEFAALVRRGRAYQQADGGYIRATVEVKVNDTAVNGRTVSLHITEDTRLYHPLTPAQVTEGAPEYEEYALAHTLAFTRTPSGAWLLASDRPELNDGDLAPSTQVTTPRTA
ncbi:hypothetical protein P6B95_29415 [Streptomyces atratus]|uniref:hypothetical protein n=1 Tax=Streptomyces atratus TaxID=1893 RepID=UPI002AC31350|nr:hypothetical protein [Streptomyces atratus]WPW31094.1 hypothetical protein P6B95_29415 [Streptomyces atratus]